MDWLIPINQEHFKITIGVKKKPELKGEHSTKGGRRVRKENQEGVSAAPARHHCDVLRSNSL